MPRHTSFFRRPQSRRGALLLVVLSILVLFALVGLTFVVAAGAFRRGADANLRRDINRNDAPKETDNVIMQLIRGPRLGTGSSILGHDLLRDMYGNGSVAVTANVAITLAPNGIDQLCRVRVTSPPTDLHLVEEYYAGAVLTFTSESVKGQSHRVLHYRLNYQAGTNTLDYVDFIIDRDPDDSRYNANGATFPSSASFVVNDPPFDGTGYGYEPNATGKRSLDLADDDGHGVAYLPNIAQAFPTGIANSAGISIEAGGADESYDAPDYQNMFLSYVPQDVVQDSSIGMNTKVAETLPSFHRQDLLRFWRNTLVENNTTFAGYTNEQRTWAFLYPYGFDGTPDNTDTDPNTGVQAVWDDASGLNDTIAMLVRKTILRPMPLDHPNFTGSNRNFNPFAEDTLGDPRWDIDNDLDGVTDSIWIDVGLPLKTDRQGRRYKPLAAILVKDLDGLINVNAHGFYSHFREFPAGLTNPTATVNQPWNTVTHAAFSPAWSAPGTTAPMILPRGSGYGPADVSLFEIFSAPTEAYRLMHQRYLGLSETITPSVLAHPGLRGGDDVRSRMATLGLPNDYTVADNYTFRKRNIFGTPPDRLGIGQTYFDYAGRPRFQTSTDPTNQSQPGPLRLSPSFFSTRDDPYELNLLQSEANDQLFSYQELERILRYEEFDSSQVGDSADRLLQEAPTTLHGSSDSERRNRRLITTASFQVPTAGRVDIPHDLRGETITAGGSTHDNVMFAGKGADERRPAPTLVTLLQERLVQANPTWATQSNYRQRLRNKMRQLLPPEILRGEPMDINRLLEAPPATGGETIFQLQTQMIQAFQTGPDPSNTAHSSELAATTRFVNWYFDVSGTNDAGFMRIPTPDGWASPNPTNPTSYSMTRQLMARHLYVMMLLLTEHDYLFPNYREAAGAGSYTIDERRELTRQRIAQWAINVVDFRDKDAVMTPFEYDLYPFTDDDGDGNPWDVDGDLSSDEGAYRRVVWGAEAPDLIITETLAFHDRRTKDTTWDDHEQKTYPDDPTLDQYRIPQGSLFLEFYNPRNSLANNPASSLPLELYDANGRLHLNKLTPNGQPVWRVLIVESENSSIVQEIARNDGLDTLNFQPEASTGVAGEQETALPNAGLKMLQSGSNEDYQIDRIIYFSNYKTTAERDREFYYRGSSTLLLEPDQYFVVAPRKVTYIGSKVATDPDVPETNENASYSFEIVGPNDADGVLQFRRNGALNDYPLAYPPTPGTIKNNLAIAVAMDLPDSSVWLNQRDPDGLPSGIGLSISEPLRNNYYPEPTHQNPADGTGPYSYYGDDTTMSLPDVPFETETPEAGREDYPLNDADSAIPNLYETGTHPKPTGDINAAKGYKSAVLQRLANPLSDHDPTYNPYITVDWMPIDLTVINGEDYKPDPEKHDNPVHFYSRERGQREQGSEHSRGNLLGVLNELDPEIISTPDSLGELARQFRPSFETPREVAQFPEEHFARPLIHTLGFVNRTMGIPMNSGITASGVTINGNYVGTPLPHDTNYSPDPLNPAPQAVDNNPFTWLHWANAPYVSEYDLMLVPTSSPQRLLFEYTLASGMDPYTNEGADETERLQHFRAPYTYLFNFFHSSTTHDKGASPPNEDKSGQLSRIFDFIHVPSRFNATNKWFKVTGTNPHFNPVRSTLDNDDPRLSYLFPFNRRSMFREPGKINLNTIPSKHVYDSIFQTNFWQDPAFDNFPDWDEFQASRRGFSAANNPEFPSRFSNPFRTAATAELMPEVSVAPQDRLKVSPVDATILRSTDPAGTNKQPLFDLTLTNADPTNSAMRHYRTDENPMLRYQAYQRLGNIAGTQSNVFAVWVTIGYFEVEPHAVDAQHPDGWALGEELGNDTGEINRHRAFYIIDRSVPVGYLPGEDLNAEQTIMLKRFIE